MFLRSLTLRGFKSFADKTVLEFTPGISAVVGPNGSGKSNVVDAISWVLGEQAARALRGAERADVIFAGTPARPALGVAEVRLVIDNSAGLIQVPAAEIEISRTIFRDGETEYRMGGRPCRLLDIQEMLSDAGLGRALHAIVGQGRLDEVLSARTEDRRQFIEEAAGIAKHRRRRERAERRLAGLEQDLLRLNDVVSELRRRLKPLEKQAELAARHEELTREADGLAVRLAAVRLRSLYRSREGRRPAWEEAAARQAAARAALEDLSRRIEALEADLAAAEEAERDASAEQAAAAARKSSAEASLREAIRRESDARERLTSATNASGRLFALREEAERAERALSEVVAALDERERESEEAEREFRLLDQARRDAEEDRRRAERLAAAAAAEAEGLRRTIELHEAERVRTAEALTGLEARIADATAREEDLERRVERADADAAPLAEELRQLDTRLSAIAAAVGALEAAEQRLLGRQEVLEARRAELAEHPAAAFVRERRGEALGVLRTLIGCPEDLAVALRAALGPFADAVVFPTTEGAVAAADDAEGRGLLFAVASGGPARFSIPGERSLLAEVRPDPRVRGLVGTLLADIYLVADAREAAAKHRLHPASQFVTREGVVVGPSFVRASAGADARVEGLRRESAAIEGELSGVRARLREARREQRDALARSEAVRGGLDESDAAITAAAEDLARVQAELSSLRRERDLLAERHAAVLATIEAASERLAGQPPPAPEIRELPPRPEPPIHLRVEVESLRRERSRLEATAARSRREAEALAAEDPVALRRAAAEAETARAGAEEELSSTEAALTAAAEAFRSTSAATATVREAHAETNRRWREQSAEVERVRERHEESDRARLDLERRIAEAERLLREGHGAEPEAAVAALVEDETVESVQRRAELVARRLELVGKVNLLAADELGSLRERHEFLSRELEDVKAARRDLEEVIREVDRQVTELFDAAFRDVAREFASLFAELFPGGEGRLLLEDPTDLLHTGVEIEARPGRKRVKRLSLLSGGERAMAAIAFLFAIFKARPSPFYVMDEVEAALDDVNLHRFIRAVESLAERSQVLIVTHQKQTMEIADALYGVSMNRDGTSRVVAKRLGEREPAAMEPAEPVVDVRPEPAPVE